MRASRGGLLAPAVPATSSGAIVYALRKPTLSLASSDSMRFSTAERWPDMPAYGGHLHGDRLAVAIKRYDI